MLTKLLAGWKQLQEFLAVDGGLYVDIFALVVIARLLGVMFGFPPLTCNEASVWAATIATFGATQFKGPRQP